MKPRLAFAVIAAVVVAAASAVAIWASIADAPWEGAATKQDFATPTPETTPTLTPETTPTLTPEATPNFTADDVRTLTESRLAERPFPPGAKWVGCSEQSYRPKIRIWLVTCVFLAPGLEEVSRKAFLLDDETGLLLE